MAGDSYTLYQAALLVGICFGDPHEVGGLLDRDEASWSLEVEQDATYWNNLASRKPLLGLSGIVCKQQTKFLVRKLQWHLRSEAAKEGSATPLIARDVTPQQNMTPLFHRFNMSGPSPFRRRDNPAIAQCLSNSLLFPQGIGGDQLAVWIWEMGPFLSLLEPPLSDDHRTIAALVEEGLNDIGEDFDLPGSSILEIYLKAQRSYTEESVSAPLGIEAAKPTDLGMESLAVTLGTLTSPSLEVFPQSIEQGLSLTSSRTSSKRPSSDDLRSQAKRQKSRSDEKNTKNVE